MSIHAMRCATLLILVALAVAAQAQESGTLERIKVFGTSLEGNLEGDDPNRDIVIYLPPAYADSPRRRFPVLYYLHGYLASAENYVSTLGVPASVDQAIADGATEMIIVFPDAYTVYGGSMYSNSPTIGDWETFIASELVEYIDENYRTIAERESRGLAGHSMGGYGTLRIGMKRPQVFGALYAASSCCLMNQAPDSGPGVAPGAGRGAAPPAPSNAGPESAGARAGAPGAPPAAGGRGGRATFADAPKAQAAAWSSNPANAPDYFDLPATAGDRAELVAAHWPANSPLVMVGQYVPALQSFDGAIVIDVGDQDPLGAPTVPLDEELTRLGIEHHFELYTGDHMNQVPSRFVSEVLPFFSAELR
jgi:enterochelin esterase-like enzyme